MFTLTTLSASQDYNRGRRDEQIAVENLLEFLTIKKQLHPDTLNLLIEHLATIDRRPRREEK
jgi:hypothetical protein